MAYKISDACVSCGACAAQCPVSAISEGDSHYEINADTCVSCGACASTCPVGAISEEYDIRTSLAVLQRNPLQNGLCHIYMDHLYLHFSERSFACGYQTI